MATRVRGKGFQLGRYCGILSSSRLPELMGSSSRNRNLNFILTRNFQTSSSLWDQGHQTRFIVKDFGVFDEFVPIPYSQRPSLLSSEGRKVFYKNVKHQVSNLFGVGMIKMNLKKWKPKVFAEEAQDLYIKMNEAYAKGDLQTLQTICSSSCFQKFKRDIKDRGSERSFEWSLVEPLTAPKVVTARVGRIADGLTLGQVVVELHTSQQLNVLDRRGKGREKKMLGEPKEVKEIYVFQRMVSQPDTSDWVIYGKITPRPLNQLLLKK